MSYKTFLFIFFIGMNIFAQNKYYSLRLTEDKMNFNFTYDKSFNNFMLSDNIESHKYSILNLSGQAIVGSALAFSFFVIPLGIGGVHAMSGHSSKISEIAFATLAISSYIFGAATGVHWVGKSENSALSYWSTVGYSAIGGGVSGVVASIIASQYHTFPNYGILIVTLCPIVSSMIYASFISDWPHKNQNLSFSNKILTYENFINYSNLINIELIHINL